MATASRACLMATAPLPSRAIFVTAPPPSTARNLARVDRDVWVGEEPVGMSGVVSLSGWLSPTWNNDAQTLTEIMMEIK
jgi:hypothetical protein